MSDSGPEYIWKNRSRRDRFSVVLDIVRTASVLFTAISLLLTIKSFIWQQEARGDDYAWKRRELALNLMRDWDRQTALHRKEIALLLTRVQGPGDHDAVVSATTTERLLNLNRTSVSKRDADFWELREHLVSLLNFLDAVSTAVLYKTADYDVITAGLSRDMLRWDRQTLAFTEAAEKLYGRAEWPAFKKVVAGWKAQTIETTTH